MNLNCMGKPQKGQRGRRALVSMPLLVKPQSLIDCKRGLRVRVADRGEYREAAGAFAQAGGQIKRAAQRPLTHNSQLFSSIKRKRTRPRTMKSAM